MEKFKVDEKGLERLKEEEKEILNKLNDIRMYKGKEAIYQGDNWHDNPELYMTESKENSLLKRLSDIRTQISNAEIIDSSNADSELINIGDLVELEIKLNPNAPAQLINVRLVGGKVNMESTEREVSLNSPMGKAIYLKRVGEAVSYEVNDNKITAIINNKTGNKSNNNFDTPKQFIKK